MATIKGLISTGLTWAVNEGAMEEENREQVDTAIEDLLKIPEAAAILRRQIDLEPRH